MEHSSAPDLRGAVEQSGAGTTTAEPPPSLPAADGIVGLVDEPFAAPGDGCGLRARKKRQAREAMHRAALELVAERGMGHVTVEMIAERAGVSPRTFFNYWDTKESAILGIVQDRAALAVTLLRERPAGEDPRTALRLILRGMARSIPTDASMRRLKKAAMEREPQLNRLSMGALISVQDRLVEAIEERIQDPEAHACAIIDVQLAFAASRAAFALSMEHGTEVIEEFERVFELVDTGRAGA